MPTSAPRPRALPGLASLAIVPLLVLLLVGTAAADPSPSPTPTCAPTQLSCHLLPPRPSASAEPTPSPTPSATPARTASPSPAPRRTSSQAPRATSAPAPGSTETPVTGSVVTGSVEIGGVTPDRSAQPSLTPEPSASSSSHGDPITRLVYLVLGAAVLLGVSGATGLYLTRSRHDR